MIKSMQQMKTEQAHILIVDDDEDNVRILETFLSSEGYMTDRAYTGQEALRKIDIKEYDLILLDVMLPDTDGYQICQKLKSSPVHNEIPITVVSALDRIDDKLKSLNLGAEDFLSKPIDEQELLLRVKKQIHNKQLLERTRREKRELKSLSNVISINYYEKTLEEILDVITIETSLLLESDRTTLFLRNGKFLISKNAQGLNHNGPLIIPMDKGIAGTVARSGEPYITNNVDEDSNFNQMVDKKTGYETQRVICCPIFHKHKVIGIIQSLNKKKPYSEHDLEMLQRICDHTSNILIRFYAEKRLKESEQLYKNLMDGMSNAIFTVENDGKISYVNRSFTKLTGYTNDEIIRKDIRLLFVPSDLTNINEMGTEIDRVETQLISKEFELIPVEISIRPYSIENKAGKIFTVTDLRDHLELEKKQVEIEKIRSDFNSMIIHDLKNPLSIIMGFAEMLQTEAVGQLNDKQREFMSKITESSDHLLTLTNEILDISKYEAGRMPLKRVEVYISDVIGQIIQTQSLQLKKKEIEILENKIEMPLIFGDPDKLYRLFTNLINNAIKFTKNKGQIQINYSINSSADGKTYLVTEVKDNGVGIPKDDIAKIFHKYKQASNKDKGDEKGTGLGLAICKLISEAHDGSITVKSEVSVGTSFFIHLPIFDVDE